MIHHGGERRGVEVCSGSQSNEVHDNPCVTPRSYLTKFASSAMTRSPYLYLIRLSDELVGFQSSDLIPDVPGAM